MPIKFKNKINVSGTNVDLINISNHVVNDATNVPIVDSANHFTSSDAENALAELFTFANDGKTAVANAVTAKGVSASPSDTFSALATKIGQIQTGVADLCGTLTKTGGYTTATYSGTCYMAANPAKNQVLVIVQGGTSSSYENILFNQLSLPANVSMTYNNLTPNASNIVGQYYGFILNGITAKVNVTLNFSGINATYDYVQCDVTVTYA